MVLLQRSRESSHENLNLDFAAAAPHPARVRLLCGLAALRELFVFLIRHFLTQSH
jgi:hypothetical protein